MLGGQGMPDAVWRHAGRDVLRAGEPALFHLLGVWLPRGIPADCLIVPLVPGAVFLALSRPLLGQFPGWQRSPARRPGC